MFKKILTLLIIISLIGCGAGGQSANNNNIQTDIQEYANKYLKDHTDSAHITAVSITAQCHNQNAITVTAGTMGVDDKRPINQDSIFQIASITKSFISVILLQLEHEQRNTNKPFSINDTVGMWFKNADGTSTYPLWQHVTIRQLLNMTSGLPTYVNDPEFWKYFSTHKDEVFSPEKILSYPTDQSLVFPTGTKWAYNDSGYILLGMLIEKITGTDYGNNNPIDVEIKSRIINKLNLHNMHYVIDKPDAVANKEQLVHGYIYQYGMPFGVPYGTDTALYSLSAANAAGAMISTTEDLNTYVRALYTSDILLNKEQLNELNSLVSTHTGQAINIPSKNDPMGFGLGIFNLFFNNNIYYFYAGVSAGFNAVWFYDPLTSNSAVMTINSTGENPFSGIIPYTVTYVMDYLSTNCK